MGQYNFMEKYLFDTSAYDEIKFDLSKSNLIIYGMAQSQKELLDITNNTLKIKLIKKYEHFHDAQIPKSSYISYYPKEEKSTFMKSEKQLHAESFILGTPNVGCAKVGGSGKYHEIMKIMNSKRPDKDHKIDCLIGEVAIVNKLTLVSKDILLRDAVNQLKGKAISTEEFIEVARNSS